MLGPLLIGLAKTAQIVPMGSTVADMVNMAAWAAHAAERAETPERQSFFSRFR